VWNEKLLSDFELVLKEGDMDNFKRLSRHLPTEIDVGIGTVSMFRFRPL
jgi:hypothetical protein